MPTAPFEVLPEEQLRARGSLKWQHYGPDVLPLWVAEMDVVPPPEAVEALARAARDGDTGYPRTTPEYQEAFAGFAERTWGWSPAESDIRLCADVMTGIVALVEALVPVGGTIVVPTPVYPPFLIFPKERGRRILPVASTREGRLDTVAIEEALADARQTDPAHRPMLLLCSPHNPTGVVHTVEELRDVARAAELADAIVVVDEVHAPLVRPGVEFTPWQRVTDDGFVVTSAAKAFNLAGVKAGLVIGGRRSRRELRSLPESLQYGASHLGILAHAAAYRSDPVWLAAVNANIADNQTLLAGLLDTHLPQVGHQLPESTYLAWLDFRATELGDDPGAVLLKRARVALTQGLPFGPGGQGHARMNVACPAAVLTAAVERIAAFLAESGES